MPAPVESELYELERIEQSLALILANACNVQILSRWTPTVSETPRVELQYRTGAVTGRRYTGYAAVNQFSPYQPLNSWLYELDVSIITDRTRNGAQHVPLIGKVRWSLQYKQLLATFTPAISPYHAITSCEEVVQTDSADDENSTQTAKITFRGIINIRDSAWPPLPAAINSLLLIDGTDFLLIDGTQLELVA